jgi:hypothetical protein
MDTFGLPTIIFICIYSLILIVSIYVIVSFCCKKHNQTPIEDEDTTTENIIHSIV